MLFVTSLPVRYHRQEPSVKQLFPPYVVARDACGQRTDAILAIPHGQEGCGKSTFCFNLLPPDLNTYYTDSIDFSKKRDAELYQIGA